MKVTDFWWDPAGPRRAPDYDELLAEVLKRRPTLAMPTIAVIGNYARFKGSALYKIAHTSGLFRTIDFNNLLDSSISDPMTALLKWSPFGGHVISDRHRSRIPAEVRVLNDTHFDSAKPNVQANFALAAGYDSRIDPFSSEGYAVVKSEGNGYHDGKITRLPLSELPDGKVCERLIDNTIGDHLIFDIRLVCVLGHPALAYVKFRERFRRFENSNMVVKVVSPCDVLSDDEVSICQRFCASIGLDYGELDILRDGSKGRIYVVDANNTPAGPPKGLSPTDRSMAIRILAGAVRQKVFNLPC